MDEWYKGKQKPYKDCKNFQESEWMQSSWASTWGYTAQKLKEAKNEENTSHQFWEMQKKLYCPQTWTDMHIYRDKNNTFGGAIKAQSTELHGNLLIKTLN